MKKIILSLMCTILHIAASRAEGGMRLLTTSFKHPELAKWAAENPVVLENFTRQDFVGLPNFNDYDDVKNAADSLANTHGFIVLEHTRPIFWESALNKDSLYELEIEKKVRNGYNFQGGYLVFIYSYEDGILPKMKVVFQHFQATQKVNPDELKKERVINLVINEIYQDAMLNFPKIEETRRMNFVQESLLNLEKVDKYYFTTIDEKPQQIKERKAKAYYFTDRGNFIGEGKEAEAGIYFIGEEWFKVCFPKSLPDNLALDNYYRKDRFVRFSITEKESNHLRDLYSESCKVRDIADYFYLPPTIKKAISEIWGMFYIENKKLVFQEVKKDFNRYDIEKIIDHPYPIVKGAKELNETQSYDESEHEYFGMWHTHPDFREQNGGSSCQNKYGFGFPSGSANITKNCGGNTGDITATAYKIITSSMWPKTWRTYGGLGIIPSSKGITIYRADGNFYKEFINQPVKCLDPILFHRKCYCKWEYSVESGIEKNKENENEQFQVDQGGFNIISYNFSYKISSQK